MTEAHMLAVYAASYPNTTDRLILADWFEDRDDLRGIWLRDEELAAVMGPKAENPIPGLIKSLRVKHKQERASELLIKIGAPAVEPLRACEKMLRGSEKT